MSATDLQALLRFLSQDAKVPLATALSKVKELQKANLDSSEKLSHIKAADLSSIFEDEKVCKQVVAAAKRSAKKRAAGGDDGPSRSKRNKTDQRLFSEDDDDSPAKLEDSLALPHSDMDMENLSNVVVFTNRAPLVLAFVVTLLRFTMPEQPLSSRLSLAQAYVSITSRSRAVNLGIESGKSAEEEGFGEGQPVVTIMGKEIRILRRWGYEWKDDNTVPAQEPAKHLQAPVDAESRADRDAEEKPPLWALDLEAQKKLEAGGGTVSAFSSNHGHMPIYTPQSARRYLLKSFDSPPSEPSGSVKKTSVAMKAAEKEEILGKLLRALDFLYRSWADTLSASELDGRTWTWYVKVRPDVENGVAGWGGKNRVRLADILDLCRQT